MSHPHPVKVPGIAGARHPAHRIGRLCLRSSHAALGDTRGSGGRGGPLANVAQEHRRLANAGRTADRRECGASTGMYRVRQPALRPSKDGRHGLHRYHGRAARTDCRAHAGSLLFQPGLQCGRSANRSDLSRQGQRRGSAQPQTLWKVTFRDNRMAIDQLRVYYA